MPKLESKAKKNDVSGSLFFRRVLQYCAERARQALSRNLLNNNVIVDRWAGAFNPVPHPLPHMHATAVTYLMAIARFHNFQLDHHRQTDKSTD